MTKKKSEKILNVHHNTMAAAKPLEIDVHDSRLVTVRIADLKPKDRFQMGGDTYVLTSVQGKTATVTRMEKRSNVTGHKNGKPVLTQYEYGAQILDLPLDTEIE
jgi:hypothetical protein